MQKPLVLYETVDHVAILTLNHPEKRNPLSRAMLTGLKQSLEQIAADPEVRAVIIRAAGSAFSAGHDLRELVGGAKDQYASLFELCTQVMESILNLPKPVIAQVQGIATAGGCQLVATCDLVVASEEATFATPGVKIGLFCTTPGVALSRAVSSKKAMEMLLTGTPIDAREAERAGLVNRVVPAERLEEETMKLARQVVSASAPVVALGKRAFYAQLSLECSDAYKVAQNVMVENAAAADAQEGMSAFLEKRPPDWSSGPEEIRINATGQGIGRKPKGRIDWWIRLALVLAVLQLALFLLPHARPGLLGAILWLVGQELLPLLAATLLVVGLIWSAVRRPFWTKWRMAGYLVLATLMISGIAFRVYPSSHDQSPSQVDFRLPLDGPVTVGWGGGKPEVNYHVTAPDQRWAYDLLVTKEGKSFRGDGQRVEDYYCYGLPVLAPAAGTVRRIFDADPDMPVGELGGGTNPGGNQIVLEVAPNEFLFICHLQPGSITVKAGQEVIAGQVLGRVGNSGNTSEPHLHIHLQDTPEDGLGEGIPMHFRNYREGNRSVERGIPTGGIKGGRFVGQIVEHVSEARPGATEDR